MAFLVAGGPTTTLGGSTVLITTPAVAAPVCIPTTGQRPHSPMGTLWTPAQLSSLKSWLQGDLVSTTPVATWSDSSGNGNDASSSGGFSPDLAAAALNNLNVVRFVGANTDGLNLPSGIVSAFTQGAIFFVTKVGSGAVGAPVAGFGTSGLNNHYPFSDTHVYHDFLATIRPDMGAPSGLTSWHIGSFHSKAGDLRYSINGTDFFTTATNTVGAATGVPTIGAQPGYAYDGDIAEIVLCNSFLTTAERQQVEGYLAWKWGLQTSLPVSHPYYYVAPTVTAVNHTTSGALTGQIGSIAGTAARTAVHPTTGALTGQLGSVSGTAVHNIPHATSGAIVGPGSSVAGTAARTRQHATSGTITGPGSSISGTSAHIAIHGASGALTGQLGGVSGTATRTRAHATTGALVGQLGSISGTAARTRAHATTGALTGQLGSISGTAVHHALHTSSGAITGPGASLAGTAARTRQHTTTGAITGAGSAIAGTAARATAPVSHATTGALTGQIGSISASAARTRQHTATGTLAGAGSTLTGGAARFRQMLSSGSLVGAGSLVRGTAAGLWSRDPAPSDVPIITSAPFPDVNYTAAPVPQPLELAASAAPVAGAFTPNDDADPLEWSV